MKKKIHIGNNIFLSEETNQLINGTIKLSISEKEKRLLSHFTQHPDTELTKRNLIGVIWEQRAETTDDANLIQLIYKTRRDLAAVNLTNCIKTIPGKGYLFISDKTTAIDDSGIYRRPKYERLIGSVITFIAFIILIYTLIYSFHPA